MFIKWNIEKNELELKKCLKFEIECCFYEVKPKENKEILNYKEYRINSKFISLEIKNRDLEELDTRRYSSLPRTPVHHINVFTPLYHLIVSCTRKIQNVWPKFESSPNL